MYCVGCGTRVEPDHRFCATCGTPCVVSSTEASPGVRPPQGETPAHPSRASVSRPHRSDAKRTSSFPKWLRLSTDELAWAIAATGLLTVPCALVLEALIQSFNATGPLTLPVRMVAFVPAALAAWVLAEWHRNRTGGVVPPQTAAVPFGWLYLRRAQLRLWLVALVVSLLSVPLAVLGMWELRGYAALHQPKPGATYDDGYAWGRSQWGMVYGTSGTVDAVGVCRAAWDVGVAADPSLKDPANGDGFQWKRGCRAALLQVLGK